MEWLAGYNPYRNMAQHSNAALQEGMRLGCLHGWSAPAQNTMDAIGTSCLSVRGWPVLGSSHRSSWADTELSSSLTGSHVRICGALAKSDAECLLRGPTHARAWVQPPT